MPPAKRKSAFFSATQEAQKVAKQESTETPGDHENASQLQGDTPLPPSSITASPSDSATVEQPRSDTVTLQQSETVKRSSHMTAKKQEKISFYLTTEQAEKLDDLAYEHKKRTGKRMNRNDIVRYLIDACSIEDLGDLK